MGLRQRDDRDEVERLVEKKKKIRIKGLSLKVFYHRNKQRKVFSTLNYTVLF